MTWIVPEAQHVIVIAEFAPVELFSTFARLKRSGELTDTAYAKARTNVLVDTARQYFVISLDKVVLRYARELVAKYPLRSLDAMQLACAKFAVDSLKQPLSFISGDNRLLTAAAAAVFPIDNPYLHPE